MGDSGALNIRVARGTCLQGTAPDGVFVFVNLPAGISDTATVESARSTKELNFNWGREVPLKAYITPTMSLKVTLIEWRALGANKPLGSAEVSLEPLTRGEEIANIEVNIGTGYKVTVSANWKNAPAQAIFGAGGSNSGIAAAAAAAGGALAAGGFGGGGAGGAAAAAARVPLPDPTGNTYTVRVKIHRLKGLQSLNVDQDPYNSRCTVSVLAKSYKTDVVQRSNDPNFSEECQFVFEKADSRFFTETLLIQVHNSRLMLPDEKIGILQLDLATIYRAKDHGFLRKWFVLCRDVGEGTVMGYAKVSIAVTNARTDTVLEFDDDEDEDDEAEDDIINNLVHVPGAVFEEMFVHAHIYRARNLPKMDSMGTCDGYVKLCLGKEIAKTDFVEGTYDPVFETQVVLPSLLPQLTDALSLVLYDHDTGSPDDLIATHMLSLFDISDNRTQKMPILYPRYINFYGHPRACDADFTRYFKQMALGKKPGVDFRGRLLVGFTGSKTRDKIPMPHIVEHTVTVQCRLELLQLSQVPSSGKMFVKAFIGTSSVKSPEFELQPMKGDGGRTTYATFCGNVLAVEAKIPVVVPMMWDAGNAFFVKDAHRGADRWPLSVWQQIPSIVIHLVPASSAVGKIFDKMSQTVDEEPTAAVIIHPAQQMLKLQSDGATGDAGSCSCFLSATMQTMTDPSKSKDGVAPCNPMIQLNAIMEITEALPATSPVLQQMIADSARGSKGVKMHLTQAPKRNEICLEVFVYHAKSIPAGDDNGLSDPYVVVSWGNATRRTGYLMDTVNPTWGEAVYVAASIYDPQPDIIIELWDHDDIGSDTFLCKTCISPNDIKDHDERRWITGFTDATGEPVPDCALLLSLFRNAQGDRSGSMKKTPFRRAQGSKSVYDGFQIPASHQLQLADHRLDITPLSLRNMRKHHLRSIRAPKLIFECYGRSITTELADEFLMLNSSVSWTLQLPVLPDPKSKTLHPSLKDGILPNLSISVVINVLGIDSLVAVATLPLDSEMLDAERKSRVQMLNEEECEKRLQDVLKAHRKLEELAFAEEAAASAGPLGVLGLVDDAPSATPAARGEKELNIDGDPIDKLANEKPRSVLTAPSASAAAAAAQAAAAAASAAAVTPAASTGPVATQLVAASPGGLEKPLVQPEQGGGSGASSDYHAMGDIDDKDSGSGAAQPSTAPLTGQALSRIEKQRIDLRMAQMLEEKLVEKDHGGVPSDTSSNASSEPDEHFWFERYDIDNCGKPDPVKPYERVARLGKMARYGGERFRGGRSTAEAVFGPFNDGRSHVQLFRGWGTTGSVKAGTLILDATLTRASQTTQPAGSVTRPPAQQEPKFRPLDVRNRTPFLCRVYIINGRDLAALDSGIMGKNSDPYVVLKLSTGSTASSSRDVVVNCKDQLRYQVLDPEFFFMRELSGELPLHNTLRVAVMDWDRFGSDELIGYTDIDLEERYYSARGYRVPARQRDNALQIEAQHPAAFYGLNHYGSYTEKRLLRNDSGLTSGMIELWVDLFDFSSPIPRPIDIAPPPPIPLELRVTVWNVRDCELTDEAITGELMTDIYVRCWVDGMPGLKQNTDTHYRSLDGTGSFNWRMIFPLVFDPRIKKIYASEDLLESDGLMTATEAKESGGAASMSVKKFFGVRKEAKKLRPRLKVQLWDNDLFPGTDDCIGDSNLDLLNLVPAFTRRRRGTLLQDVDNTCRRCIGMCDCCSICPQCCKPDKDAAKMTLRERQDIARREAQEEKNARAAQIRKEVDVKIEVIKEQFSPAELQRVRVKLEKAAKKASKQNLFQDFLPQRSKKSQSELADAMHAEEMRRKLERTGGERIAAKPEEDRVKRQPTEQPRQWFQCRSFNGGIRIGDVQLSFDLVPVLEIRRDPTLVAGKGRSEPQQLPEPDRPDSSFFWLSSPFKAALHILLKNYYKECIALVCIALGVFFGIVYFDQGVRTKAENFFK